MNPFYQRAQFMLGAAALSQCPPDCGHEVAFAGRSNVGKSSALNALTHQRSLARVSKTPGRTQQINFFALDQDRRLVDLPGYGFANVPVSVKRQWGELLEHYFSRRDSLRGVVVLMDIRHPMTDLDEKMLAWCAQAKLPVHILLTKADKLTRNHAQQAMQQVQKLLAERMADWSEHKAWNLESVTMSLFSALKQQGITEIQTQLDVWLQAPGRP